MERMQRATRMARRRALVAAALAVALGACGCAAAPPSAPEARVYLMQGNGIDAVLGRGSDGLESANRDGTPQPAGGWYAATPAQVSAAFEDAYGKRKPGSVRLGRNFGVAAAQAVAAMQQEEEPRARAKLAAGSVCHDLHADLLAVAYFATLTCLPSASSDRSMVEVMLAY